jgi:mannan endo-1,4-beta-mannosidase
MTGALLLSVLGLTACSSNDKPEGRVTPLEPTAPAPTPPEPIPPEPTPPEPSPFVTRDGANLVMNGSAFHIAGSNNYYPIFKSKLMVDALFDKAAASGFNVMRVWGMLDIGNEDGSNSVGGGPKEGVYFQYWDGTAPAYNDGANGLERLDYIIHKAGQKNIRLVIPLVNNWNDFGGMDQYVRWANGQYHDDFYTHPTIRQWYQNWVSHVLNRVNTYTGIAYKDDPTIMTWELTNEARCVSSGAYPASPTCTTATLTEWAGVMSTFIKSVDSNHLVSVGDEGFFCLQDGVHWTETCAEGVDTVALASLPNVDVMSFHLYPDHWGTDAAWGTEWIRSHLEAAAAINKPVMLGEFGFQDHSTRNAVFQEWTDTVIENGGNGALYWILSDAQDDGTPYPDYDGFTVYCPSAVCTTFQNFASVLTGEEPSFASFVPVADDDRAETAFNTPATVTPLTNDIAYAPTTIDAGSIDLDPATAGIQTTATTADGIFEVQSDNSVTFTPTPGFVGIAEVAYVVSDSTNRSSNEATIEVQVLPNPNNALMIYSFETGTENWQSGTATITQSSDFATDGSSSLKLDVASGDWYGPDLAAPIDLTGKSKLYIDMQLIGAGQSHAVALKVGSGYSWCQGSFAHADPGAVVIDVDLLGLSCQADLNDVRAILIFLGGGRTYHLDKIRAE